jgi:asparagine synthase (glutamine-hydrolysing)
MIEARGSATPRSGEMLDPTVLRLLDKTLQDSFQRLLGAPAPVGVLFSGGLDSSFLAAFLSPRWPVTLETVGVPGCRDSRAAQEGAELLGLPWISHEIGEEEIRDWRIQFRSELEGLREPRYSVAIAFGLALKKASARLLICGQGADELFLGYAHYRGKSISARRALREEDLDRLLRHDWPLAQRIARTYGRTVVAPFLDAALIDLVLRLPDSSVEEFPETKPLLRAWARAEGLVESLAGRPKVALQYGSGISRLVEHELRRETRANR